MMEFIKFYVAIVVTTGLVTVAIVSAAQLVYGVIELIQQMRGK